MQRPHYLTGMGYLLITSLFMEWNILSSPLIINSLLIWVWSKMSGLHNNQKPKTALFNIGIAIGIATFFYFPSIAFTALIIFGLAITRPFKLAEWIVALLGVITPFFFFLVMLFSMCRYLFIVLIDSWFNLLRQFLPLFFTKSLNWVSVLLISFTPF